MKRVLNAVFAALLIVSAGTYEISAAAAEAVTDEPRLSESVTSGLRETVRKVIGKVRHAIIERPADLYAQVWTLKVECPTLLAVLNDIEDTLCSARFRSCVSGRRNNSISMSQFDSLNEKLTRIFNSEPCFCGEYVESSRHDTKMARAHFSCVYSETEMGDPWRGCNGPTMKETLQLLLNLFALANLEFKHYRHVGCGEGGVGAIVIVSDEIPATEAAPVDVALTEVPAAAVIPVSQAHSDMLEALAVIQDSVATMTLSSDAPTIRAHIRELLIALHQFEAEQNNAAAYDTSSGSGGGGGSAGT